MSKLGKGIYKRGDVFWYAPPMVNGVRAKMVSLETNDEATAIERVAIIKTSGALEAKTTFDNEVDAFLSAKAATHMRKCGFKYSPHVGRHTFASLLAQTGQVSMHKIAEWLGDTLDVTTKHYAHLTPHDKSIDLID